MLTGWDAGRARAGRTSLGRRALDWAAVALAWAGPGGRRVAGPVSLALAGPRGSEVREGWVGSWVLGQPELLPGFEFGFLIWAGPSFPFLL